MKSLLIASVILLSGVSYAKGTNVVSRTPSQAAGAELDAKASKVVGELLRKAEQKGNKSVVFAGGPQVTTYSVGNLSCYFQNSDDSVSCSVGQ